MTKSYNRIMNIKHLLSCFILFAMLVSCEEIGKQMKSDNIDEDNIGMIVSDDDEDINADEDDNSSLMPKTKSFYSNLLDLFCQKHFDENFKGDHYINGSIVVVKINEKGDSTVEISGTHSYKVNLGTEVKGQMYKAKVSDRGNNTYRIKFEKGSSKILSDNSYWDSAEADFTYQ